MTRPLVSIIIPCFRQGHFLAGAVEAALGQTYPSVEVVVVNDGSDDQTDAVARGFGGRITYVSQANQGLAGARNSGIAVASGKYLHFLDADDRLDPDAIRWLLEAACGRDDVLCVMGVRNFDHDGGPYTDRPLPGPGPLEVRVLTDNLSPPLGYLSSREMVLDLGKFDGRVKGCEDWDLWSKQVFAGARIALVERHGGLYRLHAQSMSRNAGLMCQMQAAVLYRNLQRVKANPNLIRSLGGDPVAVRRRMVALMTDEHLSAGYWLREQGRYLAAASQYGRGLWRGRRRLAAANGIAKLVPHRVMRTLQPGSPVKGSHAV